MNEVALETSDCEGCRVALGISVGFDVAGGAATCLLIGIAVPGTVLAMLGLFTPLTVGIASAISVIGALLLWRPGRRSSTPTHTRAGAWTLIAGAVVVAALTLFHTANVGHHVATDRDPGIYVNTAQWLSTRGDLTIEVENGPFRQGGDLFFSAGGINEVPGSGTIEAQFLPLPAVFGAIGSWFGGLDGLVAMSPLVAGIGLFAFLLFAVEMLRPAIAALASVALGTNLVWAFFARDTYSEPVAFALLFLGAWALAVSLRDMDSRRALLAGITLGSLSLVRIDVAALLMGFVAVLLVVWLTSAPRTGGRRVVIAAASGAAVTYVLGIVVLVTRSYVYFRAHWNQISLLTAAFLMVIVGAVAIAWFAPRWTRAWTLVAAHRRSLALGAALAVVLAGLLFFFVRPVMEPARLPAPTTASRYIEDLQVSEGVPVDGQRTYADQSARWLGWYIGGIALAASLAGLAILAFQIIAAPSKRTYVILFFLALIPALLYLWKPSAAPDQIWVMRRFYIAVIPVAILLAFLVVDLILDWSSHVRERGSETAGWLRPALVTAAATLAVATVVFPIRVLNPLKLVSPQAGYQQVLFGVCDTIGDDGAVLFLSGSNGWILWSQSVRGFCNVPVATANESVDSDAIQRLANDWKRAGRVLYLVDPRQSAIEERSPNAVVVGSFAVANPYHLEPRIESRPRKLLVDRRSLVVARVPISDQ